MTSSSDKIKEEDEYNSYSEFDEYTTERSDKTVKAGKWKTLHKDVTKTNRWRAAHHALIGKKSMRLIIGVPVVYGSMLLYIGVFFAVTLGWIDVETAKELSTLLVVPGTLAATVVGFFYGAAGSKKK